MVPAPSSARPSLRALRMAACLAAAAAQRPWPEVDPIRDGVHLRRARLPVVAADVGAAAGGDGGDGADGAAGTRGGGTGEAGGDGDGGARYVEQLVMYDFRPLLPPYTRERVEELLLLPKKADTESEDGDDEVGGVPGTAEKVEADIAAVGEGREVVDETDAMETAEERSALGENEESHEAEPAPEEQGEEGEGAAGSQVANGEEEAFGPSKEEDAVAEIDKMEKAGATERTSSETEEAAKSPVDDEDVQTKNAPDADAATLVGGEGGDGAEASGGEKPEPVDVGEDAPSSLPEGEELAETEATPAVPDEEIERKEGETGSLGEREGEGEEKRREGVGADVSLEEDAPDSPTEMGSETNEEEASETPAMATEFDSERTADAPGDSTDATTPEAEETETSAMAGASEKEALPQSGIPDAPEATANVQTEEKITVHYDEESTISSATATAHKDANRQFVDGLDELDKLFESVDVPDELDVGADGSSMQDVLVGQGLKIVWKRAKQAGRALRGRFDDVAGSVKRALPLGMLDGAEGEAEDVTLDALLDLDKRKEALEAEEETEPSRPGRTAKEKEKREFPLVKRKEVQRIWKFAQRKWQQAKHILDDLFGLFDDEDEDEEFSLGDMKLDDVQLSKGGLKGGEAPNFGSGVDESFLKSRYEAMMKQGQPAQ